MSIKSRLIKNVQCSNKRKPNSEYCGKHINQKNLVRFSQISLNNNIEIDIIQTNSINLINSINSINANNHKNHKNYDNNYIYTYKDLEDFERCDDVDKLNYQIMVKTMKKYGLNNDIKCENDIKEMYKIMMKYYIKNNKYIDNDSINKIIKVQSIIRKFLVYRKKKCINNSDFFTLENKYLINNLYYIGIKDENNFVYCFDIRSLSKLLENNSINPYTTRQFTPKNLQRIKEKMDYLKIKDINTTFDFNKELTEEQEFTNKMVKIFHKFDMLDNYTDHRWFSNLSLTQLKFLYRNLEKLWNYRSQLSQNQKYRIVQNGIAFDIPFFLINKLSENNKKKLQIILLNEFERFADEGADINEKKLGVMLILTALVEVSHQAAIALPHLVQ